MSQDIVGIGIDVAKAELVVCKKQSTGRLHIRAFKNTVAGIRSCRKWLSDSRSKIIMESTGNLHLLPAVLFTNAGHDVRVINPLLAKKYSTANIRKVKTDQADAAVLAEISERERHLPPRFCLTTQDIALRQKVTLIAKLDQNLQSLQRTLGEVQRSQAELGIQAGPVQSDLKDAITKLKDNKYALEDELQKDIVAKHRGSEKKVELLTSVPGISPYLACLILQFFRLDVSNAKSWVGLCRPRHLGTSKWKEVPSGKTCKAGDPYFRKRLFSAGWGAAMNDPDFRKNYDRLKANKRHHKEATVIIARKLLATAFTVLKSGNVFDKSRCQFLDLSL
jgi:transposase